ncbi:uncharacterized protein EURHEDRAFT_213923 [Aspergillus ruber CBS 135680]|uniref:Uncharacterized protein n=1 Tax=Aspergillus ruber (strain CBS 135680) TaxID=1388766 RepID=A0A017SP05_ASPRC|nr:uncharacterized protein EURHEDRAFT_213923 [Aspergillus ruber CBS 135680]EYE98521.1 hypothetical protein EURHEDRAFT_213923 [Aspergillus ruber CBS 135680]
MMMRFARVIIFPPSPCPLSFFFRSRKNRKYIYIYISLPMQYSLPCFPFHFCFCHSLNIPNFIIIGCFWLETDEAVNFFSLPVVPIACRSKLFNV